MSTASAHEPPFATPFHFWAHALRDLLDRQGRPDLFEAMATHALCRAEEGARAGAALRELSQRVPGAPATGTEAFSASYCMIEQDVMASWVAESRSGFVAFFWLRGDWLAAAEPYDPEDAPAPGPGEEDAAEA